MRNCTHMTAVIQVQRGSSKGFWVRCAIQMHLNYEDHHVLTEVLTRWTYSTITTVLSLKMFFVAFGTHAICARVSIKSAASGTKHRHLAVISFLSHVPLLHTWQRPSPPDAMPATGRLRSPLVNEERWGRRTPVALAPQTSLLYRLIVDHWKYLKWFLYCYFSFLWFPYGSLMANNICLPRPPLLDMKFHLGIC